MNMSNKKTSEPAYKKFERDIRKGFQSIGNYTNNNDPDLNRDFILSICDKVEPVSLKPDRDPAKIKSLSIVCDVVEHDEAGNILSLIEIKHHKTIQDRSPIGDILFRIRDPAWNSIGKNLKMMFESQLPYCIIVGHYYEDQKVDLTLVENICDYTDSVTVIIGIGSQFVMKNMSLVEFWNTSGLSSISQLAQALLSNNTYTILDYHQFKLLPTQLNIDLFDNINDEQLIQEIEARAGIIKQPSLEHQILANHENRITHLEMIVSGLINNVNNDAKQMMKRLK
jgi:hypothetical protein